MQLETQRSATAILEKTATSLLRLEEATTKRALNLSGPDWISGGKYECLQKTACFISPCLSGLKFLIRANWADDVDRDGGISYRHPQPFSITGLEALNIPPQYERWTKELTDTDFFFSRPDANSFPVFLGERYGRPINSSFQSRGYLRYPLVAPTPADLLYTFISKHRGQVSAPGTCGCSTFEHFDENNTSENPDPQPNYLNHPVFSRKCEHHQDDDLRMTKANADARAYFEREATRQIEDMIASIKSLGFVPEEFRRWKRKFDGYELVKSSLDIAHRNGLSVSALEAFA